MKYAICAATPFQLLNALNLVVNHLKEDDEKDLFFRNFSDEMAEYLEKLRGYNLFDHIYEYDLNVKRDLLNDFVQARFPSLYLKGLIKPEFVIHECDYNCITVTSGTELECALSRIYCDAKTIAYDDGLGSYIGDMIHDKKMHLLWRICGRNNDHIRPDALYINNIEFCQSTISNNHIALKRFAESSEKYRKMVLDIFGIKISELYRTHRICYLTQPKERYFSDSVTSKEIERILLEFSDDCFVRVHPRDTEKNRIEEIFQVDDSKGVWELICQTAITNKHILIGGVSTAQLIPKLLYNMEPWLIFTYKLYSVDKKYSKDYQTYEALVKRIQMAYKDKYKIFIPESLEELVKNIGVAIKSGGKQ